MNHVAKLACADSSADYAPFAGDALLLVVLTIGPPREIRLVGPLEQPGKLLGSGS